jgi:hypothetical protein
MFKLNLKWNDNMELEVPGGARFCIEYDDSSSVIAMLYSEESSVLGEFDNVEEAKKFCEDLYTCQVLGIVKEL